LYEIYADILLAVLRVAVELAENDLELLLHDVVEDVETTTVAM
jgi:hypothetical protein